VQEINCNSAKIYGSPAPPALNRGKLLDHVHGAVVVAVVAVRMVQMSGHQVIDVIAVRHRFMPAAGAVNVFLGVGPTSVLGRAAGRIARANFQLVLLDLAAVWMVQMAIVDVIDVSVVLDRRVAAARAVLVVVTAVVIVAHRLLL
jgi:hypothetical protein